MNPALPFRACCAIALLLLVGHVCGADVTRLGFIAPDEEPRYSDLLRGLRHGMHALGHRESELTIHEHRVARGDRNQAARAAQTLRRGHARIAFVVGTELSMIVRETAPELPIVFITPGDPVRIGLVASLSKPGGNITGMTFEFPELTAKRLELIREIMPRARRIAVLYDRRDASPRLAYAVAVKAAQRLGLTLVELSVQDVQLNALAVSGGGFHGLLVIPGGAVASVAERVIDQAHREGAITVVSTRSEITRNALLSYGASDVDVAREAARLVDRIAKGHRPADLPVEQPTKFELVVNVRLAKAVGINIPSSILLRADKVIE